MRFAKKDDLAKQHRIILGKLSKPELNSLIQACEENENSHASAFAGKRKQAGYICFAAASLLSRQ